MTPPSSPVLELHDTLTGGRKPFEPRGPVVRWYTCGPTVYDDAHLGHARTYVAFDMARRVLEDYFGYEVDYAMNVTDVDDKIIARAANRGEDCTRLARRYEAEFFKDLDRLGCRRPSRVLRVTEHIPRIVDQVRRIEENGFAYAVADDGVYFDTRAFRAAGHSYGRFRRFGGDGAVGLPGNVGGAGKKRHPADFALWKAAKPGEPRWPSPWGPGRPGWHIECTALAGAGLDIHAGGEDLCFPHHENEVAQAEAAGCPAPWVAHWLHSGHLSIAGAKMSKSLKNFVTVRAALRNHTPRRLRLLFAMQPWWAPMSYDERMGEAAAKDAELAAFVSRAHVPGTGPTRAWGERETTLQAALQAARVGVHAALCGGIDTRGALEHVFALVKAGNAYLGLDPTAGPDGPLVAAAAELSPARWPCWAWTTAPPRTPRCAS